MPMEAQCLDKEKKVDFTHVLIAYYILHLAATHYEAIHCCTDCRGEKKEIPFAVHGSVDADAV